MGLNATSLSDLLRYPSHPDFSNSIAEELVKSQGEKVLFVLDGFDEVSHSFHENSVIKSILCRQLLPECTIILTTRPVAKVTLESICQPRVDKHVEIIGFTEEERVRYITEVFSKEPELQVNFLKYMFLVPHIKSVMYIPLNCAIISQVYYESQSSHHLAIQRTKTQLYKALSHCLLIRHMKTKDSNCVHTLILPQNLDEEHMKKFKTLSKFVFDSYHILGNGEGEDERKVTFFKEDIPEGLVHFGLMNESTEMYVSKGVEQTFSFLHLSLQEYLAAWHLADSYSIEFQVAYHRISQDPGINYRGDSLIYKGDNKDEEALISSLKQQRSFLVEPAIFLAGITGWRCQSEGDRNHWEMYLSHDTVGVGEASVLLRSLYEAHNPTLVSHYFADYDDSWRKFLIGCDPYHAVSNVDPRTPFDINALSYCLANSSDQLCYSLSFGFNHDNDISLVETFVKGLDDHCLSTVPGVKHLEILESSPSLVNRRLPWLMKKANFLSTVEESVLDTTIISNSGAASFLQLLVNLHSLKIQETNVSPTGIKCWEWLAGLKYLNEVKVLDIFSSRLCTPSRTALHSQLENGLIEGDNKLTEVILDVKLHSNAFHGVQNPTDVLVDSLLKSVLRSNQITKIVLPNISCETMVDVCKILQNCPSLITLELKRTRLGYDGIVSMCSALRNNTTLKYLVIDLDHKSPHPILPEKTTCINLLRELSHIVIDNSLEVMNIQSDSFSTGDDGEIQLKLCNISSDIAYNVLQTLVKVQLLKPVTYCEWVASSESLSHLQELHISNKAKCSSQGNILDIKFPTTTITSDICNRVDKTVDLVQKFIIRLSIFDTVGLSNISRETMAGIRSILLHCPSLSTLELKGTRLGYDGILYICGVLKCNSSLRRLVIHDSLNFIPSRKGSKGFTLFSFMQRVPLPGKTTCTDFLLELNNILKDNCTLEEIKIHSGLFLPLSVGKYGEHCQWTGLGPLQQFNAGTVSSGFSSSDLTQPQTTLCWDRLFGYSSHQIKVDFKKLFSQRERKGKKLCSLPSFTAADTEVLQSFSGLDHRLKACLGISDLQQHVKNVKYTYLGTLKEISRTRTYRKCY